MVKIKSDIHIEQELLLRAKNELSMSLDEFVEYALTMYLHHEDKYAKLFYDGAKAYSELKKIQDKMQSMDKETLSNENQSYDNAMETVNRINEAVGYVGKDRLRHIASTNNISPANFIKYVESLGIEIRNFTNIPR